MLNAHTHREIEKAVIRSQHTQRNWDLTKRIPQEDIDTMLHAVTNCPSKQNIAFYKVHFIEDRSLIEDIHNLTYGFGTNSESPALPNGQENTQPSYLLRKAEGLGCETNPQTLANLLVIFEEVDVLEELENDPVPRNAFTRSFLKNGSLSEVQVQELERDRSVAVGIAAGYLNIVASLMGYRTGCCQCFHEEGVQETALLRGRPLLLMGVGFPQEGVSRRQHHIRDFKFKSKKKQPIQYEVWK